jgi:hypothetical protein
MMLGPESLVGAVPLEPRPPRTAPAPIVGVRPLGLYEDRQKGLYIKVVGSCISVCID